MKLLLIKAGKALKTIQREGFLKGGKRVFSAFFALFRVVGSGQILFITGGVGDSARYRTWHVSEELELNDFKCAITVQDNPWISSYVDRFEIFVFHRVLYTPSVKKMIEKIKAQKKEIIFETDDLVYDAKYLEHMDYFKVMNSLERRLYENGVGGEILNDPYVKVCSTSTNFLAEKLRENNKEVFVVPNRLSQDDVENSNRILGMDHEVHSAIRIGYFSGALSHNKDFATIHDALMMIMEKYTKVELWLVGPLDLLNDLNKFSDRIKKMSFVPREQHFQNIANVDINIAPLEIGNPFCESKSELKFFEAAIMRVPTVAAATEPFRQAIVDGEDGYVANGTQEWFEKLEKLVVSEQLRQWIGSNAREKALKNYTTKNASNKAYYGYLKSRIKS